MRGEVAPEESDTKLGMACGANRSCGGPSGLPLSKSSSRGQQRHQENAQAQGSPSMQQPQSVAPGPDWPGHPSNHPAPPSL